MRQPCATVEQSYYDSISPESLDKELDGASLDGKSSFLTGFLPETPGNIQTSLTMEDMVHSIRL